MKEPPKSALSRTAKLLGTGARAVFKEAQGRATKAIKDKLREEQLELIVSTLGELKGSAMKAGQMLALETQDWLPNELQAILLRLNHQADPVDFSVMEKVLIKELGKERYTQLKINPNPIAAASIGQVYRGMVDTIPVAIKVQYPGVKKTVGSDLKVLEKLMRGFNFAAGKRIELKELFEELAFVLNSETQYSKELKNLNDYKERLKAYSAYQVPAGFSEYSTDSVLTMEFLEGQELHTWISTNPSNEDRYIVGNRLIELYLIEFYLLGMVQTDPNLANFKVAKDNQTVQLLDFGSVLRYDLEFRKNYFSFADLVLKNDFNNTIEKSIQMNLLSEKESVETRRRFFEVLKLSVVPFGNELFDFQDRDYSQKSREVVWDFVKNLKYTPPPRTIIFLHRRLGGLFQTLKKMDLKMNLREHLDSIPKLLEKAEANQK